MKIFDRRICEEDFKHGPALVVRVRIALGPLVDWQGDPRANAYLESLNSVFSLDRQGFSAEGGIPYLFVQVCLAIQRLAGETVRLNKIDCPDERGICTVAYQCRKPEVGLLACDLACQLICSLLPPDVSPVEHLPAHWNWEQAREGFIYNSLRYILGFSGAALCAAAKARSIPWFRVDGQYLIQLGYGKRQRRFLSAITDRTGQLSVEIAANKRSSHRILKSCGLPVPKQSLVHSEAQAEIAAKKIGYPAVTKPCRGSHGGGVSLGLSGPNEVRAGFVAASAYSREVVVEEQLPGNDYRLLVVGYRLIAAVKRTPPEVCGDGIHTIKELVAAANQDPRRGIGHEAPMTQMTLDAAVTGTLSLIGFTADSILPKGMRLALSGYGNLSRGASATDVTDLVHPDNCRAAEDAVAAIGLDVAGVDFICPGIHESWRATGGGICEINSAPGLRAHLSPSEGRSRDVAGAIIDMLYPSNSFCFPSILLAESDIRKGRTTALLGEMATRAGLTPGIVSSPLLDATRAIRKIMLDPRVDFGIFNMNPAALRAWEGLDVRISAFLDMPAHPTPNTQTAIRHFVDSASVGLVLNADDDDVAELAKYRKIADICLVSADLNNDAVQMHIRRGGAACILERPNIVAFHHGQSIIRLPNASNNEPNCSAPRMSYLFAVAVALCAGWTTRSV